MQKKVSLTQGMVVAAVVALMLAWNVYYYSPGSTAPAIVEEAVAAAGITPSFQLGEIVIADYPSYTPLMASPAAGATMERLELAGDNEGISELMGLHLMYQAEPQVRVRVIGFDAYPEEAQRLGSASVWVQVRALKGALKGREGRAGWLPAHRLKRK